MIDLNFINPEEHIELHKERIISAIRDILLLTCATASVMAVLLLGGRTVLERSVADITTASTSVKISDSHVSDVIARVNAHTEALERLHSEFTAWTEVLSRFSSLVTPGNHLTSLTLDRATRTLRVGGVSETRETLLAFKQALESSPDLIASVTLPIANLLQRTDVAFDLSIILAESKPHEPPSPQN